MGGHLQLQFRRDFKGAVVLASDTQVVSFLTLKDLGVPFNPHGRSCFRGVAKIIRRPHARF